MPDLGTTSITLDAVPRQRSRGYDFQRPAWLSPEIVAFVVGAWTSAWCWWRPRPLSQSIPGVNGPDVVAGVPARVVGDRRTQP